MSALQGYSQTFSKVFNYDGGSSTAWSVRIVEDGYIAVGDGGIIANDRWIGLQILKTDFSGNMVFFKGYGKEGYAYWSGYVGSATLTPNGVATCAIFVDSLDNTKLLLARFDKNGDTLFTKKYGDSCTELGRQCRFDSDGNFILLGETAGFGFNKQYHLLKVDSIGNKLWDTTYGGVYDEIASSLEITKNGFMIGGATKGC